MKWIVIVLTLAALGIPGLRAQQDPATAAAEREQAEERHRTMVNKVTGLEESIAAFHKNVSALRDEVRLLKEELDRFKTRNEGAAAQENIKRLAEKIEEVDKKRQADNEKIVKYIDARNAELQKVILDRPSGSARPVAPPSGNPTGNPAGNPGGKPAGTGDRRTPAVHSGGPVEKGFVYKIKSGDRLQKIVARLKAEGFKTSDQQIMDANPTVDWTKLKIDQKIFIPDSR